MEFEFEREGQPSNPRKAWVATLFSLLMPGLGQVYNGQFRKGATLYLLSSFIGLVLIMLSLELPVIVLGLLFLVPVGIYIWSFVDAFRTARQLKDSYQLKKYNRPLVYIILFVFIGIVVGEGSSAYIRTHVVKAYKIPASSMMPTLLVGDHILVDRSVKQVVRGDIIVFEYPPDEGKLRPRDFVKRVIGMPGDRIKIIQKNLYVNEGLVQADYAIHNDPKLIPASAGPRDDMSPIQVPEGSLFVLGDNRDYSFDSRFWGFVEFEKVRGKAIKTYWSWDSKNSEVRWERIGARF